MHSVTDGSRFLIKKKDVALNLTIEDSIPENLMGDPVRLRQILVNLLSNANKFTESGKIDINLKILKNTLNQIDIQFEVKDTGIGISEQSKERLFLSFFQADSSITRKYGGTGLGLTISKQLVSLMKSQLQLKSTLGKGSNFYFCIKFDKIPESVSGEAGSTNDLNSHHHLFDVTKCKILVVEDNPVNQIVIEEMIHSIGCKANIVDNCQTAIDTSDKYDIIFMDLEVPEIDGYEATQKIGYWLARGDLSSGLEDQRIGSKGGHRGQEQCS